MAEHGDRTGTRLLSVVRAEETAGGGTNPQHLEVIARDDTGEDALGARLRAQAHRRQLDLIRVYALERRDGAAYVLVERVRDHRLGERAAVLGACDVHEPIRIGDASRRA